jgi:monovalent cation:H+ antiporter-2, CPA2 family
LASRPSSALVRLLRGNDIAPTVIELNIDAVRALRDEGVDAVYGDATRPETLEAAGVDQIYSGEGEVALAFIEDILDDLGATAEQIDRERARAHEELLR